jgi:predicted PurR-regulated permease PerM
MHELMIFFGTLGGIFMFGITGIFIGPLIASLFITVWELYGIAFNHLLPEVYYRKESASAAGAGADEES